MIHDRILTHQLSDWNLNKNQFMIQLNNSLPYV